MQEYNLLSVKELRTNFPAIQQKLLAGQVFVLLSRSKPIARIFPVNGSEKVSGLDLWSKADNISLAGKKIDAVKLIRQDRN